MFFYTHFHPGPSQAIACEQNFKQQQISDVMTPASQQRWNQKWSLQVASMKSNEVHNTRLREHRQVLISLI